MAGKGGKTPGAGRKKGSPNKLNAQLKEMILGALHDNGGQAYLKVQALANPTAFMSLLSKVLPMTIAGDPTAPMKMQIEWEQPK